MELIAKEPWLYPIDDALLRQQRVNGIRPPVTEDLDDDPCTSHNACVGAVVDSKLEHTNFLLGPKTSFDKGFLSTLL